MKEEKFKVLQFIRELLIIIEEQMDNFPKKDIELKNHFYKGNYNTVNLKHNYLKLNVLFVKMIYNRPLVKLVKGAKEK